MDNQISIMNGVQQLFTFKVREELEEARLLMNVPFCVA